MPKKIRRNGVRAVDILASMRADPIILRGRRFGLLFRARTGSVLGNSCPNWSTREGMTGLGVLVRTDSPLRHRS